MFGADGPQLRFIVSLEPSQALTRHKLWLALDQAFRAATATFSQKQAILARLAGDPPPPDMGPKPDPVPRQSITTPSNAGFDREALRGLVKSLSKRFADHPNVDNGDVLVQVLRTHLTTVTSEGVVLHEQRDRAVLVVVAEMRAPDGMQLDAGGAIHLQTVPRADDDLRKSAASSWSTRAARARGAGRGADDRGGLRRADPVPRDGGGAIAGVDGRDAGGRDAGAARRRGPGARLRTALAGRARQVGDAGVHRSRGRPARRVRAVRGRRAGLHAAAADAGEGRGAQGAADDAHAEQVARGQQRAGAREPAAGRRSDDLELER
jgi:hypothetical protein